MPVLLSWIFKNSKYLLIVGAVLALVWTVNSYFSRQAEEKAQLLHQIEILTKDKNTAVSNFNAAKAVADANHAALQQLRADKEAQEKITAELNKRLTESSKFTGKLIDKINSSKPEDDGPVAPVLLDAIRSIQSKNVEVKK